MTPSSTIAEAGEETFERSMPATPVATATELPPPGYDLVPGNLTLAASGASYAPSLSSSMASQYDPASLAEEEANLKDVSGVSTPTGTPRQAHRELDLEGPEGSIAGSSRDVEDLDDKIEELVIDDRDVTPEAERKDPEPIAEDQVDMAPSAEPVVAVPVADVPAEVVEPVATEQVTASSVTESTEETKVEAKEAEPADLSSADDTAVPTSHAVEGTAAAVAGIAAVGAAVAVQKTADDKVEETAEPAEQTTPTDDTPTQSKIGAGTSVDKEATPTPEVAPEPTPEPTPEPMPVPTPEPTAAQPALETDVEGPATIKAAPAEIEPEVATEVLAEPDTHSDVKNEASDLLNTGDDEPVRSSQDTLRAVDDKVTSRDSLLVERDSTPQAPDREATPQPQPAQLARDDTPVAADPAPALDDDSDIVSVQGATPSFQEGDEAPGTPAQVDDDMTSDRSSLPPARASSELEFRYEDYQDHSFRDQSASQATSAAANVDGSGHKTRSSVASASEVAVGVAGVSVLAAGAIAAASDGNGDETMFPAVPTADVEAEPAHKPVQVHVEPSPYGPVSETKERPSDLPVPTSGPNGPTLTVQAPSPSVASFDGAETPARAVDFPVPPTTSLPEAQTPLGSRPVSPPSSGRTVAPAFPVVPDEEHPYVSVHTSPSRGLGGGVSFPRGAESPSPRHSRGSASSLSRHSPPQTAPRTPPMDSPSLVVDHDRVSMDSQRAMSSTDSHDHLSIDGHESRPPRQKRISFTPRSPLLDDEDPGDFEPGEGWVVSGKWEQWRGPPMRPPLRTAGRPATTSTKPAASFE